jgi:hypothetical protein
VIPPGTPITDSFDVSGFIGGFQGGCNWQWGVWVFGIEGDGSATNKSGQQFEGALVPLNPASVNWVSETQERWLVTAEHYALARYKTARLAPHAGHWDRQSRRSPGGQSA